MVWSDQSQFPFYVIDNNGNIIFTIDETGAHLTGQDTGINLTLDGSGSPPPAIIEFTDLSGNNADSARIDAQRNPFLNNMSLQIVSGSSLTAGFSYLFLDGDKTVLEYTRTAAPASTHRLTIDSDGCHVDGDDWTNLTMQGGWTGTAGYDTPQARLNPLGAVEFRGVIHAGAIADATNVFDIPAAFAPVKHKLLRPAVAPTGAGSAGSTRLFCNAGDTNWFIFGANAGATSDLGLDGLSYYP